MILNFSKAEFLKGMIITPGWYKASIKTFDAKPPKGATDSMNFKYTFAITIPGRPEDEKPEIEHIFNSKAKGFMIPFIVAITGKPAQTIMDEMTAGSLQFDTEACVGQIVQVKIENEPYEGRLTNKIKNFLNEKADLPF